MAKAAGDYDGAPVRSYQQDRRDYSWNINIGATGAPTLATDADPGFTIARNSAGNYSLTFPPYPAGGGARLVATIQQSAAGTVVTAAPTALDMAAGTATLITRNAAGAATDPANGDKLNVEVRGKTSGAR